MFSPGGANPGPTVPAPAPRIASVPRRPLTGGGSRRRGRPVPGPRSARIVPPLLSASPRPGFMTDSAGFSPGGADPGPTVPAPAARIASALPAAR